MTIIIGMDPHKRSATIEIIDTTGRVLTGGRYATDTAGYTEMLSAGRKFVDRVWGCRGLQRHRAPPGASAGPRR
ncbi:hypothetical protein GCM10027262_75760 [Nocardia tengchongensis]